jgi:hypothetical protein
VSNGKKGFVLLGGVLGVLIRKVFFFCFFFGQMAPSLRPLSVRDSLYIHCYGLYTLGDFLKHVKNVHPLINLVPQAS